jgi:hypothetical protein
MGTLQEVIVLSSRIDHLEQIAEWIARETANQDASVCQSATLITVLIDDIRTRLIELVRSLEESVSEQKIQ